MMVFRVFIICLYVGAIVAANLLIAAYGPAFSIINAFVLIGFDLVIRDYLHDVWQDHRLQKMSALIATAGVISYVANPASGRIALASFVAFIFASLVDWIVYHYLRDKRWMIRANGSNVAGAGADSILFPTIAFGFPLMIPIMLGQFVAKIFGGLVWSIMIGYARASFSRNRVS